MLENLNLLAEIPESTLESIVKLDNFPQSFFNWVLNNGNDNLLMALLSNPNLTLEHLNKLTSHKNPLIALEAKLHINWDGEIASVEDSIKQVLLKKSNNVSISKYTNIFLNLFRKGILNKWSKEEWATPIAFCLRDSEILLYLNNQDRNIFNASDKNCADFNSQNNDVFLDKNLEDITSIRQYDEDEMSNETFDREADELDDLLHLAWEEDDPDILHEIYHSIPSYSSNLHYTAMDIYKALIKNYYTPSSVLADLFGDYGNCEDFFDMDIGSAEGIVFHPNAPTNSLESLADVILRYIENGDIDEKYMYTIKLRRALINNQNTPVELLEKTCN